MRYLSLCSGIEAASVAWEPLGWEPVAFAEIEAFPSAVLKHHYPRVPNLGDITKFEGWPNLGTVDLVCGGTPCQSFSVAGLRAGLADPRGNLMLTFLAIVGRYRPRWVVWENVPGVLSSGGGRDFGTFLSGLGQLGYGWAYRVLDAQFTRVDGFPRAVPQRRRRVFVVGCLGDWRCAAAVLSERQSLLGDSPPRRKAGERPSPTLSVGAHGSSGHQYRQKGNEDALIPSISNALAARDAKQPRAEDNVGLVVTHALKAEGFDASEDGTGRGVPLTVSHALTAMMHKGTTEDGTGRGVPLVAFDARQDPVHDTVMMPLGAKDTGHGVMAFAHQAGGGPDASGAFATDFSPTLPVNQTMAVAFTASEQANGFAWETEVWQTLNAQVPSDSSNIQQGVRQGYAVRRLTPIECERLMGFPDGYTDVPYRGKPAADGPRYRALGNSWAVNVVRWVGRRIEMVESLVTESLS